MARVTGREVKGIIQTRFDEIEVEPFVDTAHVLVDTHLAGAGLSEELLKQIELWLAAHLIAIDDPRTTDRNVDGLRISFERAEQGKGLDSTRYGQQVRMLDPTGKLAQLSNPKRQPWVFRAGSPPSRAW